MTIKSFSNNFGAGGLRNSLSPAHYPAMVFNAFEITVAGIIPNLFSRNLATSKLGDAIADLIGYEPDLSEKSVYDAINNDPKFGGISVEAERQQKIQDMPVIFDTAIDVPVLAIQPYYYGRRLDGSDPALNVLSHLGIGELVAAKKYARGKSLMFGIGASTAIGSFISGMYMIGSIGGASAGYTGLADTFSPEAFSATSSHLGSIFNYGLNTFVAAVMLAAPLLVSPAIGRRSMQFFEKQFLSTYFEQTTSDMMLNYPTKDYKMAYRLKMKKFKRYLDSWEARLQEAARYKKMGMPTISLGTSSGEFRAMGLHTGLEQGAQTLMSVADCYTNLVVFGGTGAGKTSAILSPIVRQLFIHRRNGTIGQFGMFVLDSKGVLWVDIKAIAVEEGLPESAVTVIGCLDGQYGVNILKGIAPQSVSTTISEILFSDGGGNASGGGKFYEDMFNLVSTFIAFLLDAYDRSPAGSAFTAREYRSVYCVERIYTLLSSEEELDKFIFELLNEVTTSSTGATFYGHGAADAVAYFQGPWQEIADETKSNLKTTVQKNLGALLSDPILKARFMEGRDNIAMRDAITGEIILNEDGSPCYVVQRDMNGRVMKFIDVDGAFKGSLVCVNISTDNGGKGAKFTLTALSTRFKLISVAREIEYKTYNDRIADPAFIAEKKRLAEVRGKYSDEDFSLDSNDGDDFFGDIFGDDIVAGNESLESSALDGISHDAIQSNMENSPTNDEMAKAELVFEKLDQQLAPTFYLADEFQNIAVNGDAASPASDSTYWAKNRSKGVIGIVAFQFLSSIQKAMGHDAASAMLGNFRNKIVLQTEDIPTIESMIKLMGKGQSFFSQGKGYFGSQPDLELARINELSLKYTIESVGAYPNMQDGESDELHRVADKLVDGSIDMYSSITAPAQYERLSHVEFEARKATIEDDNEHKYNEQVAQLAASDKRAKEGSPDSMISTQSHANRESIAGSLHDAYDRCENEAMDSKFDVVEDYVSIEAMTESRMFAICYIQSYSGVLKDFFKVKQDHVWSAERKEIHAQIKAQNDAAYGEKRVA